MADTAEIIAIMRHAAARLEEEDAQEIVPVGAGSYSWGTEARARALSADLAMTYAAVVLRMVAAVMDETPEVPGA
jgi:hypothetical protein